MRSIVALFALLLGGCFSYVALGTATPRRGTDVIAKLSAPLAVALQDVTVREVNATTGKVTYADDDSLVLAVEHFRSEAGTDYPGLGTTITIRRDHIAELQERRIAAGKTDHAAVGRGRGGARSHRVLGRTALGVELRRTAGSADAPVRTSSRATRRMPRRSHGLTPLRPQPPHPLLPLLERARPVVLQQPGQGAVREHAAAGLTRRAVIDFVLGIADPLYR